MGLDITAYEKAELLDPHEHTASSPGELADECYEAGHLEAWVIDPSFLQSLRGLKPNGYDAAAAAAAVVLA
jgi:hypothetical protein